MNTIPNPDSWSDVVTIIIVTAIVAGPTWLTARANRAIKDVHQQVSTATPARCAAMLDEMRTAVSSLRDEVRGGFSSLRADLAEERSARRDGDVQLSEEILRASDRRLNVEREAALEIREWSRED